MIIKFIYYFVVDSNTMWNSTLNQGVKSFQISPRSNQGSHDIYHLRFIFNKYQN